MFELTKIINNLNGKIINGDLSLINNRYSINTRTIKKGDFYIPIIGKNLDGHDFIIDAIKKDAIGTLIDNNHINKDEIITNIKKINPNVLIILVSDTLKFLHLLAGSIRNKNNNTILIAITGSNGKTSTKELVYEVLSKKYKVLKSLGNLNNHIGLPLTLLNLNNHDICVVEMGMNHLNEISKLSLIAKPDIAVITNIGTAHIGILGSKENILKAKTEIIDGLKDNGRLLINGDDEYLEKINYNNILKYGINNNNLNFKSLNIRFNDYITFKMIINNKLEKFKIKNIGKHHIYNSLVAISIGIMLNVNIEDIKEALLNNIETNMRMEEIKLSNNITLINDAYNANFESTIKGLEYLQGKNGKKIVVLADMLELGDYSKEFHKKVGEYLFKSNINTIALIGTEVQYTYNIIKEKTNKRIIYNDNNLINILKKELIPNSIIYFKGSRSMKLEEVINKLI